MRARNIKPGFFKNEELADCDPLTRLLFIGLWCLADREGRLEFRQRKIKAEVFPYDNCSIVKMIEKLTEKKFLTTYTINGQDYIQINNFTKHQNCHVKEVISTIPALCLSGVQPVQAPDEHQMSPAESLLLNPESLLLKERSPKEFIIFWNAYPQKKEKQYAAKIWKKLDGSRPSLDFILSAIKKQKEWRENANGEFRPEWKNPSTWLNRGCWDDELLSGGNDGNRSGNYRGSGTPYPQTGRGQDDRSRGLGIPKEYKPEHIPPISEEDRERNLERVKSIIDG